MVVSGHANKYALVLNLAARQCSFKRSAIALKGHSDAVVCTSIWKSLGESRIATVAKGGEVRLWDAERGGGALWVVETGLVFSQLGSCGAISLDGKHFLWAVRSADSGNSNLEDSGQADLKWSGRLVDVGSPTSSILNVIFRPDDKHQEPYSDWDGLLGVVTELMDRGEDSAKAASSSEGGRDQTSGGMTNRPDESWRFGGVCYNRLVNLRTESGRLGNLWRVVAGTGHGDFVPRLDCALRLANGTNFRMFHHGLCSDLVSLSAAWILRGSDDRRRAVVACQLSNSSVPAIVHITSVKA